MDKPGGENILNRAAALNQYITMTRSAIERIESGGRRANDPSIESLRRALKELLTVRRLMGN